jgi:glutaminyl-tRNA synthetase
LKNPINGEIEEIHCTYDPETRGGNTPPDGRKVKATIHWVSAAHAVKAETRLYDNLFTNPSPTPEDPINPKSLETVSAYVEPSVASANPGDRFQFERMGYFCVDQDSAPGKLVFNRTVTLQDTWAKIEKKQQGK